MIKRPTPLAMLCHAGYVSHLLVLQHCCTSYTRWQSLNSWLVPQAVQQDKGCKDEWQHTCRQLVCQVCAAAL